MYFWVWLHSSFLLEWPFRRMLPFIIVTTVIIITTRAKFLTNCHKGLGETAGPLFVCVISQVGAVNRCKC
jgi:hypothetical protein